VILVQLVPLEAIVIPPFINRLELFILYKQMISIGHAFTISTELAMNK